MARNVTFFGEFVTTRTIGIPQASMAIKQLKRRTNEGFRIGLQEAMDFILAEATKVTPIDTGRLRKSGRAVVKGRGQNIKGYITYSAPYAVYVHEDLTKWHAPGTYAKFLTRTMEKYGAVASQKIAVATRRHLRGFR